MNISVLSIMKGLLLIFLSLARLSCTLALIPTASNTRRATLLYDSLNKSPDDNQAIETSEYPSSEKSSAKNDTPPTPTTIQQQRDLSPQEYMRVMNTSPRRILLSFASASTIALGANFLGITSKLLETVPESTVEATGLDTYFPRGQYKRVKGHGYTLVIPKEWVADTAVELAKIQRRAGTLDYRMSRGEGGGVLPDAAYGPPGRLDSRGVSKGDTNVSVVVSKVKPGFSLRGNLGTPTNAADTFLKLSLAPEGSGRTATLVTADEDVNRQVYQFEYDVDRGERGPSLKAISLIAVRNGSDLLTLTVVAPQEEWNAQSEGAKLRKIASSFHLTQ